MTQDIGKKCKSLRSKRTLSQKSSTRLPKIYDQCCHIRVTQQLNFIMIFGFTKRSTFLVNSDGFELHLKQHNNLVSNAARTSSIIINHDEPYE
jgi:hypothetical protein